MRIKLDENMPVELVRILNGLHHQVETVPEEGLAGHDDEEIWAAAQQEERFLITQDLDFSDVRRYRPGSHHGLMLVRLRSPGRLSLVGKVREVFEAEDVSGWHRCFIVLTERKLRIHSSKANDLGQK